MLLVLSVLHDFFWPRFRPFSPWLCRDGFFPLGAALYSIQSRMSLRSRPFWTNSWNRGCFWLRRTFFWIRTSKSISQSFSALCAAACEHFSAILGCHSLHKAVLVLSLKLLGLVSSFHLVFLLIIFSVYLGMGIVIPYKAINIKILYLIYSLLSRGFLHFSTLFSPIFYSR